MNVKLPKGISDYKRIVEENYVYVDKTKYIELFERFASYAFFLRPRRFGKSLFISVIDHYYGINHKDDFEKLFGNTYIGKNPTGEQNKYYILRFSFSALMTDTEGSLIDSFRQATIRGIDAFCGEYGLGFPYPKEGYPSDILNNFLTQFKIHVKGKVYFTIDEYDHFANELLGFNSDLFLKTVSRDGFIRKWYEAVKEHTATGTVARFFATGVSPLTLDSLTSGFNITTDLTRHVKLNEAMGFTESEARWLIDQTLSDILDEAGKDRAFEDMRTCYNGYKFNEDAKQTVFNSNMSLNYLSTYVEAEAPPKNLIDTSTASDYFKLGKLFELKNKSSNYEVLQEIIEGKEQETVITQQFNLARPDFHKGDFKSLLFYLGYLTICGYDSGAAKLKVPNYVTKELYFKYFEQMLKEEHKYELNIYDLEQAVRTLGRDGDNTQLITCIENVLKGMSNRDSIKLDEKYVKTVCFTLCTLSSCYVVESENEANKGYCDIQLTRRPGIDVNYYAIIEFKYLPKEQESEKEVSKKLAAARAQLEKYNHSPKFKGMKNLKKWAVIFVGDQCVRNEMV